MARNEYTALGQFESLPQRIAGQGVPLFSCHSCNLSFML